MFDQLSDMNMSPEALETADTGAGWNLAVPDKANAGRKKGIARWLEFVKIEDAYHEDNVGEQGQIRLLLTVQYRVIAGGDCPENTDRTGSLFMRLNPGFVVMKRDEALGQGDPKKESIMHSMAMKKLKQIMVAVGLPISQGLTKDMMRMMFPPASDSASGALISQKLAFQMRDNANKQGPSGENQQEPENILAAPKGV